jgi:hypothetical protein
MLAHRFFIFLVAHCELVAVTLVISRDSGLQEFVQTFKDPKIVHVALDGLFWADAPLGRPTKELFWADPRWVGPQGIHPEWPRRQDLDRHRERAALSLLRQLEPRRMRGRILASFLAVVLQGFVNGDRLVSARRDFDSACRRATEHLLSQRRGTAGDVVEIGDGSQLA